jgi:hypothetical protein
VIGEAPANLSKLSIHPPYVIDEKELYGCRG